MISFEVRGDIDPDSGEGVIEVNAGRDGGLRVSARGQRFPMPVTLVLTRAELRVFMAALRAERDNMTADGGQ